MNRHLWLVALLLPILCIAQDQNINSQAVQSTPIKAAPVVVPAMPAPPVAYESGVTKLRDLLKLQASQGQAWTRYIDAINVYSKTYYEEKPIAAFAADTGPRQVGRLVDILQNRLAALDDIESTAKDLYVVLDEAQKKIADQFMVASVPIFSSVGGALCPDPSDKRSKSEKPTAGQRSRRTTGAANEGMSPTGVWNN